MALYDGFFDATYNEETQEYDRAYGSGDFTNYFGNVIGSGVCIHNNPDSFKAEYEDGTLYLRPGYLFIRGYWLANNAGEGETNYKGYAVTIPSGTTGSVVIVARLNMGSRMIELKVVSVASSYPDSLVLAIVDTAASTVQDTRHDKDLCGIIDTAGELSSKVDWAISYINNEIEGKLAQVEAEIAAKQAELDQEIAAQEAELDAKINEAQQKIDSIIPDPIGTIKFSAAETMGANWLRCNGDFISTEDYPELVEAIGKVTPGVDAAIEMGKGLYNGTFSTSYVKDGYLWVYWVEESKLLGFKVNGTAEDTPVQISLSTEGGFEFAPQTENNPIVLSVLNGYILLAQRDGIGNALYHIYASTYTGLTGITKLVFTSIETYSLLEEIIVYYDKSGSSGATQYLTGVYKNGTPCLGMSVPEAVLIDENIVIFLGMFASYTNRDSTGSHTQYFTSYHMAYLYIPKNNFIGRSIERRAITNYTASSSNDKRLTIVSTKNYCGDNNRFGRKTNNELFLLIVDNIGTLKPEIVSLMSGIYNSSSSLSTPAIPSEDLSDKDVTSPIATDDYYIIRAYIKDGKLYIRAGTIFPLSLYQMVKSGKNVNDQVVDSITISPNSNVFPDSMEYISTHNLYVIFIGTGICFSKTPLDMKSWGYLDTTEYFGTITQFGCCEFDAEKNTLVLSGRNTLGNYVAGMLELPEVYDYATDGAWLPALASGGVPGWVKAKENENPVVPTNPVLNVEYLGINVGNLAIRSFTALFDGVALPKGTLTRNFESVEDTFTVGIRNDVKHTNGYAIRLIANGANVASISTSYDAGTVSSATLRVGDYLESGLVLSIVY